MIICSDLVFIHNLRTSGTNITGFISKNCDVEKVVPHLRYNEVLPEDIETFKDKYIFGFVRNPYERELSLYTYIKNNFNHRGLDQGTFKDYVMSPIFKYMRRQWVWFADANDQIPSNINIFKYEDRDNAIDTIAANVPSIDGDLLKNFTSHRNKFDDTSNYQDHYDQEMVDFITPYFQKDIELFDYKF